MTDTVVLHLVNQMLLMALKLSAPVLLATLVVGVAVSILQAATQVQEMTLTFVPKMVVLALVMALLGPWMLNSTASWAASLIGHLELYAR
ncbi:MAG: flagellar biosynthesis protein FliQ [Armatimonadetes bacterium]|jgi:flagellar biosynthetic protein FliQ|nr:flagellar biosynthesis protein FliQ [Armatimonadota bacterium]MDI9584331.1 flagellar biosynthesis protein FliQ [Acidobacteriota bacterium]